MNKKKLLRPIIVGQLFWYAAHLAVANLKERRVHIDYHAHLHGLDSLSNEFLWLQGRDY